MSGGGSSMITTPVWLMMGFPLPVAICCNVVNGACWTLVAARNYLRGHTLDWRFIGIFIAFGLVGAFGGTKVIMSADPKILQKVFGIFILGLVALAYFKKDFGLHKKEPKYNRFQSALFALPLGFYEAFFGSGNGIFTSAVLTTVRGFTLLEALGYYYLVAFAWCVFSSCLFISAGHYDLSLIIPAIFGSVAGAQLGSRIGKKYGSTFVKTAFMLIGTVLGCKLLLF